MKRITFLAAFIIAIATFNTAKAQVGVHIGVNIGTPVRHYYAPAPVYYAPAPVYYRPAPVYYRSARPVVVRRSYVAPRRVIVVRDHPGRGWGRGHGWGHGHGRGHGRW
jgi:hypothetical protein